MKKWIAVFLIITTAFALAACGAKAPAANETTETAETTAAAAETSKTTKLAEHITTKPTPKDPATEPEEGLVAEKDAFYVYVPEEWCRMEYASNGLRIRLFDTPSAPDIKQGETPEIEIIASEEKAKKDDVKNTVAELLKTEGAKEGKNTKIAGGDFSAVTYKGEDKRTYIEYVGVAGGRLVTVTLKGVSATDEETVAILNSLSFKK